MNARGDAVIVWLSGSDQVKARRRSAAGVLGPVRSLSTSGQGSSEVQVAIDIDGDALVTWTSFDGVNQVVQARSISKTSSVGPVQAISGAAQQGVAGRLAMSASGHAVLTWMEFDGVAFRIKARTRTPAGALGPIKTLSGGVDAAFPVVAMDAQRDAYILWEEGVDARLKGRARRTLGCSEVSKHCLCHSPPPSNTPWRCSRTAGR